MAEANEPIEKQLTDKERRFVEEYCSNFNATQAALRAGYSERTARQIGYENLTKPYIKAAVNTRLEQLSMSAAEATKRLTDWGRGSIEPFTRKDEEQGLVIDLSKPEAEKNLHLIKKIKQTKKVFFNEESKPEGTEYFTEIELHDAKDAVIQIAKIRQIFVQKIDHTSGGKSFFDLLSESSHDSGTGTES